MLEWLKRHAWKACKLQKGFRGSNPRLSARITESDRLEYIQAKGVKRKRLAPDARGRRWGLRRNPRLSARI